MDYPCGSDNKKSAHNVGDLGSTPATHASREDHLEKGMATHSSILVLRAPWTEEPGGLQAGGHKELDTTK